MRWFFLILAIAVVATVYALGPRGEKFSDPPFELFPDMDHQFKKRPQEPSSFFADGQVARKPVEGTVPLGFAFPHEGNEGNLSTDLDYSRGDDYYNTGQFGDFYGSGFPEEVKIDEEFLARGKERFHISCSPCHGDSGDGQGVVSKYWAIPPTANLIDPRVIAMPEGQIFWTITHGKGLMGPYNGVIPVKDRWAITAYLKALQAASGN
ncbi:MAG: cytochrome c class I [Verrucomicrobiales bacterium]|nr:cytochrome c class I [Verrucomicrobiales bacterium]